MGSEDDAPEASAEAEQPDEEPSKAPSDDEASEGRLEALREENASLKDDIESVREEVEDLTGRLARARADHANYKKRVAQMKDEAARDARIEMIKILVDVLDNVERALSAGPNPDVEKGLEMVMRTVEGELERVGVETIDPEEGDAFDPAKHEAVLMEPSEDHDAETILEALAPGYAIEGRQIRPATVKVSTGPNVVDGQDEA